jgi:hypothetical protein
MTTLAEGAAAVGAALNLTKELVGVNRALNEAEFKLKIAEVTSSLATVKISLADAQQAAVAAALSAAARRVR